MKSIQKYRALGIIVIAFVFFNTFMMSDSGWVDENDNIYSHVNGNVGIGTETPEEKLHISGHLIIDKGEHPRLYGCVSTQDMNLYLKLLNSPNYTSSMGLKAGGILVSDSYSYADPGKNDLVVKGNVGIGTSTPAGPLHVYSGSDVTLSGGGNIILGDIDSYNIGIDGNEIMARNNGAEGALHLNADGGDVKIRNNQGSTNVVFLDNGKVGIGTSNPDEKLTVDGKIHAEEIIVDTNIADFVFENDYQLASLSEVEEFIEKEGHLPEIPCAAEVEKNGVNLGEMNTKLLQMIEEMTLYIIEQNKQLAKQNKRIEELEKKMLSSE